MSTDLSDERIGGLIRLARSSAAVVITEQVDIARGLDELLRHRAAQTAGKEHVRQVVREAVMAHGVPQHLGIFVYHYNHRDDLALIADHVAERLPAPVLSDEERATVEWLRGSVHPALSESRRAIALLDRLLGGAK